VCVELLSDASIDDLSVLIAYTNLALDHMLTSILDAKITTSVVRLGSRATDENIAQYSLHKLEQLAGRGELDRPRRRQFAILKTAEEQMSKITNQIQIPQIATEDAKRFLDFHYPQHADRLREPPFWVAEVFRMFTEDENENGEWKGVSRVKKSPQAPEIKGIYGFWKSGRDINFIGPPSMSSNLNGNQGEDPRQTFFDGLGFSGKIPQTPSGKRPLEHLVTNNNIWSMSLSERRCLAESWEEEMRRMAYESNLEEFYLLKQQYKDACQTYEDLQDEVSRLKSGGLFVSLTKPIARLDVDFLVKPTSLRALLLVRTSDNDSRKNNLISLIPRRCKAYIPT
jgi:hypothetical protein